MSCACVVVVFVVVDVGINDTLPQWNDGCAWSSKNIDVDGYNDAVIMMLLSADRCWGFSVSVVFVAPTYNYD